MREGSLWFGLRRAEPGRDGTAVHVLAERYERGSVLIPLIFRSPNETIFRDPAGAINRLVHHSVIFELNIASCRIEQANKNQQQPAGEVDVALGSHPEANTAIPQASTARRRTPSSLRRKGRSCGVQKYAAQ